MAARHRHCWAGSGAPVHRPSPVESKNVPTRFNAILGALFVVVVMAGPPQDALFGAVLAANTAIGVVQEIRARNGAS
jgi:hypothetical protein